MNAHLAYSVKRSYVPFVIRLLLPLSVTRYVFDNYTWSRDMSSEYSEFNGRIIPARIPLSALIAGALRRACSFFACSLPQVQ